MPHESEATFHERVRQRCIEWFGADAVESNKYLEETGRYVDLWVEGPLVPFAIEIENDWESVPEGIGQSLLYASDGTNAVPVVVLPPRHVDYPEVERLRAHVPIVELDV